jgi:hypothetical protein
MIGAEHLRADEPTAAAEHATVDSSGRSTGTVKQSMGARRP